jgi:hypothetical protein
MLLLPNMYPFDSVRHKPIWSGGVLRIGCFCAIRPYKNVLTAAAAALEVGVRLRVTDLEFWISSGRMTRQAEQEERDHDILARLAKIADDQPKALNQSLL